MKKLLILFTLQFLASTIFAQRDEEKSSGSGWIVVLIILGVILVCLLVAVIMHFFKKPKHSILEWFSYLLEKIGTGISHLVGWMMSIYVLPLSLVLVYGIVYYPLRWGQSHLSPVLYYTLIGLSFVYFFFVMWYVSRKEFYLYFKKKGIGAFFPLMLIIGLLMVGVTCFSAFTAALSDAHAINLDPAHPPRNFEPLVDFYIWHFCNLIPQIDVAETLHWKVKYTYNSNSVGWLVLIFKSLMAFIIIERIVHWNKWRKEDKKEEAHEESKSAMTS
jgi:hypothetical protein